MPAHPKTTDAQIVQAALELVERHGRDGFSMNDVAGAVGIRAPSLYNRFRDRASLLAAVELRVWADLVRFLGKAVVANDPEATLIAQAQAIRRVAKRNPNSYSLFFDIRSEPSEEGTKARAAAVATLLPGIWGTGNVLPVPESLQPTKHGFLKAFLIITITISRPGVEVVVGQKSKNGRDHSYHIAAYWRRRRSRICGNSNI